MAAIALIGYHVGTFDQIVHLPFLRAAVDPGLLPGDGFVALRHEHCSPSWLLLAPFTRAGVLEPAMLAVHLLATHLTFAAIWELSMALYGRPAAALLAVLATIMPHAGFVGFWVYDLRRLPCARTTGAGGRRCGVDVGWGVDPDATTCTPAAGGSRVGPRLPWWVRLTASQPHAIIDSGSAAGGDSCRPSPAARPGV